MTDIFDEIKSVVKQQRITREKLQKKREKEQLAKAEQEKATWRREIIDVMNDLIAQLAPEIILANVKRGYITSATVEGKDFNILNYRSLDHAPGFDKSGWYNYNISDDRLPLKAHLNRLLENGIDYRKIVDHYSDMDGGKPYRITFYIEINA